MAAMNSHLQNYHAEYDHWIRNSVVRLLAIFPFMLVADLVLFAAKRNGALLVGPYPWWVVVVIVSLEFLGGVWLMRTIYRTGLERRRLDWQEHPVPVDSVETGLILSGTESRDQIAVEPDEKYLGGFYSLQMSIGYYKNARPGYGVYVTNKRLFGISQYCPSFDKRVALIPQNLPKDESDQMIREITQTKLLEVRIEDVAKIELKIPPGLFRTGHLQITRVTGDVAQITVGRKRPGEQLRALLQVFGPNVLTVL